MKVSPLQVCNEGSNWEADGGARFNCLSMVKNLKVRHTRKAGPRSPRVGLMVQRWWISGGRMCRRHSSGIHMEMSAAQSKQDTWKDSSAAGVRPTSLWRVPTPKT